MVVLNLGESASWGTGITISTLFAVDLKWVWAIILRFATSYWFLIIEIGQSLVFDQRNWSMYNWNETNLLLNWDLALTIISILLWACRSITDSIHISGWELRNTTLNSEELLWKNYLDMSVESVGHQLKLSIGWNEGYCSVILKPAEFINHKCKLDNWSNDASPLQTWLSLKTWTDEHTGGTWRLPTQPTWICHVQLTQRAPELWNVRISPRRKERFSV